MKNDTVPDHVTLRAVTLPQGKVPVYQSAVSQGISSDAAELVRRILSDQDERPRRVLELGCGTGIMALMLAGFRPDWKITGVDIQPELIEIARLNALNIGVDIAFDVADFTRDDFPGTEYDLILGNPPYYPVQMGRVSPIPEKAAARHELYCTLPSVVDCLSRGLAPDGNGYLMYPCFREVELLVALRLRHLVSSVRADIPCRRPGASTRIWQICREGVC
jgi:tRNA1(Val) A37 N6-methylase TrmN6